MPRRSAVLISLAAVLLFACQFATPAAAPAPKPSATVLPLVPTNTELPQPTDTPIPAAPPVAAPTVAAPTVAAPTAAAELPPAPTADAAASAVPQVLDHYEMILDDGMGYGVAQIGAHGKLWEVTSDGGVRVYDNSTQEVVASIPLAEELESWSFVNLAQDEKYIWALFYEADDESPGQLFRIAQNGDTAQAVELPEGCLFGGCAFRAVFSGDGLLWVGGYGALLGLDPDTLETVVDCDLTQKIEENKPFAVMDIASTGDGRLWLLMSSTPRHVAVLQIQDLRAGGGRKAELIDFTWDNEPEWIASAGERVWAGLARNEANPLTQQAQLIPLAETGVEMTVPDSVMLPEELDQGFLPYGGDAYDGRYLWLVDGSMKRIFAFDPQTGEVAHVLDVYTGDQAAEDDPHVILGMAFDGIDLWLYGVERIRVGLPWTR